MGITIIPAITPISGSAASMAGPGDVPGLSAAGSAIDFAALLGGQIAGLASSSKEMLAAGQPEKPGKGSHAEKDRALIDDLLAPLKSPKAENIGFGEVDRKQPAKQSDETEKGTSEPGLNSNAIPVPAITAQVVADNAPPVAKDATLPQLAPAAILAPGIAEQAMAKKLAADQANASLTGNSTADKTKAEQFSTALQAQGQAREIAAPSPEKALTIPAAVMASRANAAPPAALALPAASTQAQPEPAAILAGETPNGNSNPPLFSAPSASPAAQQGQAAANNNPTVNTPIQDKQWPHDFSERIVWLAKNDQQVAQINISPAQLGPVQITLNLNGDQASITFASPHAEVRKAIEEALPNLREMLSSAGINLGQSNVGAQSQQQPRELPNQFANGNRLSGENAILPAESHSGSIPAGSPIQRGRGLIDLFA